MIRLLAMICAVMLVACADLPSVNRDAEIVNLTAHTVDTWQTYKAATDPCYREIDPMTRRLIGHTPSHAQVIGWGLGYAALHYGIYRLLADHGHDYLASAWEAVTLESTGTDIAQNVSVGIRLGSRNTDSGCYVSHQPKLLPIGAIRR